MYADKILNKMKTRKIFHFIGCYPVDRLPTVISLPCSLIINLDTSDLPGSHWVAVYINKSRHAFYFDSYGSPPTVQITKWLKQFKSFSYNKKCFQSIFSKNCGFYCIYFIYLKHFCFNINDFPKENVIVKTINNWI